MTRALLGAALFALPVAAQRNAAEVSRALSGLSEQQKQQLKAEYARSGKTALSPDQVNNDTALIPDTSGKDAPPDSSLVFSAYENMLRGISINPDSLLPRLRIFGTEVFEKTKPSTFTPSDKITVPSGYPVGPGDEVIVMLWGRINEEYRMKVDRDGKVNIPRVGPVSVAGLSFSGVQKNVLDRVQTIEGVQASVTMGDLRSIQVFIVGEVRSPGVYTVSALTNVTNALFAAGGPTRRGSLRNIELTRNGNLVRTIDFYDFLMSGKNYTGLRLEPGDVIHVPVAAKMAAIAGNVRQSALFELKGKTTLQDLVELAGGITPAAWVNRVQVERFADNKNQVVLDLQAEPSGKLPDFEIKDGDVVKVFPIVVRDQNAVYLSGNVQRPGKYEFREGIKVTDVLVGYDNLLSETYFDYAVIKRQDPPHFRESLVSFSLRNALDDPNSSDNLVLKPRDMLIVFHRDFFEPDRTVMIGGAVNKPGNQRLLENMTIRDLVVQAGGLREDASPQHGELYRRTYDGEDVKTEKIGFCVQCALQDDPKHNLKLEKFDRVLIRTKKGWEEERRVSLKGEVVFPGEYVLLEGETLAQLIDRAGGFTQDAYLPGAIFTRVSVRDLERRRLEDYSKQLEMDILRLSAEMAARQKSEEAQALLTQQQTVRELITKTQPIGRVVIDLTDRGNYEDFILENGDVLYVPKRMGTVSVLGEVFNPATFTIGRRPASAGTFVQMSGGYKEHADKGRTYIIKANGSVVTGQMANVRAYHLEPGDAIVVPQRIKYGAGFRTFVETVDAVTKITTVLALTATVILQVQAMR